VRPITLPPGQVASPALLRAGRCLIDLAAPRHEVREAVAALGPDDLRYHGGDQNYMNLLAIFGREKPQEHIKRLAEECARQKLWRSWLVKNAIYQCAHGEPSMFDGGPRLDGWDEDVLREAQAKRRGFLVYIAHFGAFRVVACDLLQRGFPVSLPLDHDSTNNAKVQFAKCGLRVAGSTIDMSTAGPLRRGRTLTVIDVERDHAAPLKLVAALRRGEAVVVHADGNSGFAGKASTANRRRVHFFGHELRVKGGVSTFAALADVPVLAAVPVWSDDYARMTERATLRVTAEVDQPDQPSIEQRFFSLLERAAAGHAEQWEGVCQFHRWRIWPDSQRATARPSGTVREMIAERLRGGTAFQLDSGRAACLPTADGMCVVDVRHLQALYFSTKTWDLLRTCLRSTQDRPAPGAAYPLHSDEALDALSFLYAIDVLQEVDGPLRIQHERR
jgi:lauroyl/myristoyl acyltransferase